MTDTANAPERIWAFRAGPMGGLFIGKKEVGPNVAEYVLSTHYDELVAAAHEEAFARGANWAQEKARVEGRLVVVDSPELAKLRADLAEAQAKIARLTEALAIAGPIALKVFDYHLFTLDAEDQRKVETIRAALQENANG